MISFGQWLPDQPVTANKGIVEAKNCIASKMARSFNGLSPYSGVATNKILGAFASKDFDDNNAIYAGDTGKLYKFNSADSSLTDVVEQADILLEQVINGVLHNLVKM